VVIPAVPEPDALIDAIRTLDEIFLQMAEADGRDLPVDDAVEELWTALECGALRLVVDGDRLVRVEPFEESQAERLLMAEQHWPLVAVRRRVLCGLYDDR
jgi:hypothetical protein